MNERTNRVMTIKANLRNNGETLLFEMGIKGESSFDSKRAHDLKTYTINETEITPPSRKHGTDAGTVYFTVNKMNIYNRQNIFLEKSYGIHAKSVLRECEPLYKYVIACKESFVAFEKTRPRRDSMFMVGICAIKEGI